MRRAAAIVFLCAACADPPPLELPALEGYSSMILTAENSRGLSGAAYAIDSGRPSKPIALARSTTDPATLRLYLYRETLDALGLEEGTIDLAPQGALAHAVDPAAELHFAEDPGEGDIPWFDDRDMSRTIWVSGAHPITAPCPELTVHEHRLPKETWISVALPLDDHTALVATREGAFFRASSSTITRIRELDESTPHGAGFKDDEGVVWLTGCEGQLARLYPDESYRLELDEPCDPGDWLSGASVIHLEGSRGDVPREFFTMTRHGHFSRHTERSSEVLVDLMHTIYFHYVNWIAPGEGIMVTRMPSVVWFREGRLDQVTPVWIDPQSTPEITNVERAGDRGVLFAGYDASHGTRFNLFESATKTWRVEAEKDLAGPTYDLRPRPNGNGFVFGGAAGHAGLYTPDTGFCETIIPSFVFYYAVPIGDRAFLLVGFIEAGNRDTDRLWWVEIGE